MQRRTVKYKMKKIIQVMGDRQAVADNLGIDLSYVYKLTYGFLPGGRLYRDISKLYNEIIEKEGVER